MPAIIIDGKNLNDCTIQEAFLAGAHPDRAIFDAGDRLDYYRNCTLLTLFGDREHVGIGLAIERYADRAGGGYSVPFNALRAGELMNWACRHGLVDRVDGPAWRLVVREQQFELVGPETNQRAVRVRGLTGAEAVVGAQLWDRELKRREKARVKRVARVIDEAKRQIGFIGKHEPSLSLGEELVKFAVGDVGTVVGAQDYILDTMLPLSAHNANVIAAQVQRLYADVCQRQTEIKNAERRRRDEEDMAELSAMFAAQAAAAPPPPPRVPSARVEWSRSGSQELCVITGTAEGVQAEADYWRRQMQGYGMCIMPAVEIEPGVWQSNGSHWDNCD